MTDGKIMVADSIANADEKDAEQLRSLHKGRQDFTVSILRDRARLLGSFRSVDEEQQTAFYTIFGETKERAEDEFNRLKNVFGSLDRDIYHELYMDGIQELADEFGLKLPSGMMPEELGKDEYDRRYNFHIVLSMVRHPTRFDIFYSGEMRDELKGFEEANQKIMYSTMNPCMNYGAVWIGQVDGIPLKVLSRAHRMSHELGLRHTPHTYTWS